MSTKFPLELPAAFGIEVYCPESAAAAAALSGTGEDLCRSGEALGYSGDLCSYVRMGMALAEGQGAGRLPRPDLLLCCDNICAGMVPWYQAMARTLGVPLFLFNIPYQQAEPPSPEQLRYLREQFDAIACGLEALTGIPWDPARFEQACRQANRSVQAWQAVLDAAQRRPSPLDSLEIFNFMPQMVTGRCAPETERRLTALLQELEARPAAPARTGDFRIFWEGSPCWPAERQIAAQLRRRHIQVVADTLSPSLCFRYSGLDGLLQAYCGTINGVSLEEGVRMRAALCRAFGVEGVLVHYNRSCRPWCGALQEVERRLRRELNVPVVAFEGDQAEPNAFLPAQFETRLDALADLMAAARVHSEI